MSDPQPPWAASYPPGVPLHLEYGDTTVLDLWEDAVRLDLHYVENRSLELDLDILLRRTLPAVLGRRGAY